MTDFNPTENFFQLLGLPQQFELDQAKLSQSYRQLQQSVHPDRFAAEGERQRLLAVQKSSQINEAFEVLRSPTQRAAYLLKLAGVDSDLSSATFRDTDFLMQQMMLREELSELSSASDPEAALDKFYRELDTAASNQQAAFAGHYQAGDYMAARDVLAKMHFLDKLRHEAEQKEASLLDY
ncbi:Fe-S protein assembly co-chaperone HscB [Spongiibacter sp. KMU-158]|uniref:Co-chaperone protein HscB homolog n=1 Tax=Spongiibacter pelagi TaxID=2760804 RepID=A0A927C156_9GAMM|nr:Fe-S protein assembly co-chaperone HscB [Spongiibacter pelagi]MBD2858278.1 Fe-S protein assembly co-chaperone HscB [Spongiibacter pelagi]